MCFYYWGVHDSQVVNEPKNRKGYLSEMRGVF
jgi:hypothetical protein